MRDLALVVEDDPDLQREMAAELARMDFEVRGALHYEGAIEELARSERPRLVCVDLGLPTRSGYELCEYIRGRHPSGRLPILVTSDSAMPEDLVCAEQAGANAFLQKPFSMREFTRNVEQLLDGPLPSERRGPEGW